MFADMFDRFKTCDQVDTVVLARNLRARALNKMQVATPILCLCVSNRGSVKINPDHS